MAIIYHSLPKIKKGITSVIGSGGKTSLIHTLCRKLTENGTVIFCTTTNIYPSEEIFSMNNPDAASVMHELAHRKAVCIGKLNEKGKFSASDTDFNTLRNISDYVMVEADGSRHLPIKAFAPHEPVIPEGCENVIQVIGASGIGQKIKDCVHRYEVFCNILNCGENDIVTVEKIAAVINSKKLCNSVFVNQIDNEQMLYIPERLAELIDVPVYYGSLQNDFRD